LKKTHPTTAPPQACPTNTSPESPLFTPYIIFPPDEEPEREILPDQPSSSLPSSAVLNPETN
jgi:hypothetical protein